MTARAGRHLTIFRRTGFYFFTFDSGSATEAGSGFVRSSDEIPARAGRIPRAFGCDRRQPVCENDRARSTLSLRRMEKVAVHKRHTVIGTFRLILSLVITPAET